MSSPIHDYSSRDPYICYDNIHHYRMGNSYICYDNIHHYRMGNSGDTLLISLYSFRSLALPLKLGTATNGTSISFKLH